MSHNAGLSAVVDITSPDNMRADILLCPSLSLGLTDTVALCLGPVFKFPGKPFVVFFTITFLLVGAEAFAITEHVSLDTAFWWALSTASTVGYDAIFGKTIPPHSIVGKFVTLIIMLLGIGIVGMLTSSITSYLMRKTNGANTLHTHDDIELVLKKLDDLEKQNKDLADQNKQMQAEIQSLKKRRDENDRRTNF